jgi:hypothetical protein
VNASNPEVTLRDRISSAFACGGDEAERKLLIWSIPAWKRPLWWVVDRMHPPFFQHDRDVIREACEARYYFQARTAVDSLQRGRHEGGLVRKTLGFRVSGQKLLDIAGRYLRD